MNALEDLQQALDAARAGALDAGGLARRLREARLPADLPPRFGEVLAVLADRIESAALFSGESCSFSSADQWEAVAQWMESARARLQGGGAALQS